MVVSCGVFKAAGVTYQAFKADIQRGLVKLVVVFQLKNRIGKII